jgi:CRISPR-associated exonuclease Cas4
VIYDDLFETGKILVSNTYPLSGKPDYIMKHQKALIPIEVKTGNHHHPLAHHCMQLACYCQLVSDEYGIQVPFGMLVYSDTGKQFNIPYDAEMKRRLHATFYNMEQILQGNHFLLDPTIVYNKHKCSTCSMNSYCDIPKRPS